jgi:hypothetical protein
MLAAIHLVLWGRTNGLNPIIVSPLITWSVLVGGCYGTGRMIWDILRAMSRDPSTPGTEVARKRAAMDAARER